MPTNPKTISEAISEATTPKFRGRLIARGQARAMIWRNGELPQGSPDFSPQLSFDLHSYGYSLLDLGLRLLEMGGDPRQARLAFEQAATALEAVISKAGNKEADRTFHFVMTASSYHLAHLSARAYSLLTVIATDDNFSPTEQALAFLMRRDITALRDQTYKFHLEGYGSDTRIADLFEKQLQVKNGKNKEQTHQDEILFKGLDLALTDNFFSAIAQFLLALERGEDRLVDTAVNKLRENLSICAEFNLLPQWWSHRIAIQLLPNLWANTFHKNIPLQPLGGEASDWETYRKIFIASLGRRKKAEVDLWPSQIIAANRTANQKDDLVVSLPTSAGKTRIAELCILRCLAEGRQVMFITPLRALSAQTEITLYHTFAPLGKTVSALYGSIGVSSFDKDTMRGRDIIVATPEKLDFALRNDPSLLDDIGLLVFDEGHMIGPSEREVHYEIQIQRLLKRPDANMRRIVCLSAILPDDDQLEDFSAWLCRDHSGDVLKSDWRPTRLRFGEVIWNNNNKTALLNLRVGEERPFVPHFLKGILPPNFVPPKRKRTRIFPSNQQELSLATAWQLVEDGQTVLLYCPERRSVEPFAEMIIDLHQRGALKSLLTIHSDALAAAITLGEEWLGTNSNVLKCLRLGVALHHGSLPTAYRKEVEKLLRKGILKVTISSPTLAQGLNLSATAIIIHSMYRHGERIDVSEFKNVIGRAGRAYVDVEGIVLFPIFEDIRKRKDKEWASLIEDLGTRNMESGLIQLIVKLLRRMHEKIGGDFNTLQEYVMNNAEAWSFPEVFNEKSEHKERAMKEWQYNIAILDTAILHLIGDEDICEQNIEIALDSILQSSLWQRRLLRRNNDTQRILRTTLLKRSHYIWEHSTPSTRRGYFLAGLGLAAGHSLDAIAAEANLFLAQANNALLISDYEEAVKAITGIAELVFTFHPFKPDPLPDNWRDILHCWLYGQSIADLVVENENDTLRFIENGLVYHLPWAMEALRVRAIANNDLIGDTGITMGDSELGLAVPAVETGTMNRSASILIQAGFNSRLTAIKVINDTGATFINREEFRAWLQSPIVSNLTAQDDWPSVETKKLWLSFLKNTSYNKSRTWKEILCRAKVNWYKESPTPETIVTVYPWKEQSIVLSTEGRPLGVLNTQLNPSHIGVIRAKVANQPNRLYLSYLGPNDLLT